MNDPSLPPSLSLSLPLSLSNSVAHTTYMWPDVSDTKKGPFVEDGNMKRIMTISNLFLYTYVEVSIHILVTCVYCALLWVPFVLKFIIGRHLEKSGDLRN